ncbi:hypothetical protein [Hyalangium rubrum]|uniref:Cytochrome C Planctomycete-type domain-containing protein n=1 Tax=Hyalangium rubrum TaxID=3103134 RepID=A0ABU5H5A8_9BACT|nr:hypothetical protein [Hyalangium sp. s54d21]MDY7228044.1 hypothetical protein [Hyalangium sp. s54d21]
MSIRLRIRGAASLFTLWALMVACGGEAPVEDPSPTPQPAPPQLPVIEPKLSVIQAKIFDKGCGFSQCHGTGQSLEALDLSTGKSYAALINTLSQNRAARSEGLKLVVPGKPEESFLVQKLRLPLDEKYGVVMPRGTEGAKQNELDAIVEWIRLGALND